MDRIRFKIKEGSDASHAKKAARYFLKAALFGGSAEAEVSLINLGLCYAEGFGVEKDYAKAAKCYRMAGSSVALGVCYAEGLGVEKDMVKAEDLLRKGGAFYFLERYWIPSEVIMWMRKAGEKYGNINCQRELGDIYKRGRIVAQDLQEAVKWYRKAAEQGNPRAQYELAGYYARGEELHRTKPRQLNGIARLRNRGIRVHNMSLLVTMPEVRSYTGRSRGGEVVSQDGGVGV